MSDSLTIEVPLGSAEEFHLVIVREAARQMLGRYAYDPDGDEHRVATELARELRKHIEETIREEAKKAASGIVAQVLDEGFQPTDTYGQPRGERIALRAAIAHEVKQQLTQPVGNSYDRKRSVLAEVIYNEVTRALNEELKGALNGAKTEVVAAVKQKGVEVLTETMRRSLPL